MEAEALSGKEDEFGVGGMEDQVDCRGTDMGELWLVLTSPLLVCF